MLGGDGFGPGGKKKRCLATHFFIDVRSYPQVNKTQGIVLVVDFQGWETWENKMNWEQDISRERFL